MGELRGAERSWAGRRFWEEVPAGSYFTQSGSPVPAPVPSHFQPWLPPGRWAPGHGASLLLTTSFDLPFFCLFLCFPGAV